MFFRSLARASTLFCTVAGALLAVLAPAAHAGPPTITGNAVTAQVPNINDPAITINLRELGVIAGSAPLLIDPSTLQILVNGQTAGGLGVALFPNNGPGRVCIGIFNQDFTVGTGQAFSLQLVVTDLGGIRVGPVTVPITNTPGSVVDTTAEQAACDDRNTPPVANAGPDQTSTIRTARPASPSRSTVPRRRISTSTTSSRTVVRSDTDSTLGPASTSPVLNVTLAPGVHNIQLSVTDESSDTGTSFGSDDIVVTVNAPADPDGERRPRPQRRRQRRPAGRERHARRLGLDRHRRHDRLVRVVPRLGGEQRRESLGNGPDAHRHACPTAGTTSS